MEIDKYSKVSEFMQGDQISLGNQEYEFVESESILRVAFPTAQRNSTSLRTQKTLIALVDTLIRQSGAKRGIKTERKRASKSESSDSGICRPFKSSLIRELKAEES